MATKVHMEALSPTMEEGQLVKWLKSEGDAVTNGDILAEIETDKATMELVARGEGVLKAILLGEGGTAPVGDVIAVIAADGEDVSEIVANASAAAVAMPVPAPPEPARTEPTASPPAIREPGEAPPEPASADTTFQPAESRDPGNGRVKASPLARRLAAEAGLHLAGISGSGPGGRIVKRDIEATLAAGPTPVPTPVAAPIRPASEGVDFEDIPLTQIRKTIARRLAESLGPVPHFFLTVDIDMARSVEMRQELNALLESRGGRVSFNDIIIKATALALRQHPSCNAWWGGDHIRQHHRVHIGIAVAIEDGLITPVVRDADAKGISEIAAEVRELAGRARDKRLTPDEYTGSTFSISNLGMFGIEEFTAVINPPEAGILAIGALEERPVIIDGELVVRARMRITMSCDHRVIDGAQGSRFLATLRELLEEPMSMLL